MGDRGLGELAFFAALEHLEHLIDRPFGQTVADADADDVVKPAVFLRRGLEGRGDAQIIVGGLDHFAASNAVEYLFGAVAQARIAHADDGVVVGLEDDAYIEEPGAVAGPDRLPVATAGQQRAAQALALEAAAGDDADAPVDTGRLTDIDRRLHFEEQREDRPHLKLGHFLRQNFGQWTCGGHRQNLPADTPDGRRRRGNSSEANRTGREAEAFSFRDRLHKPRA